MQSANTRPIEVILFGINLTYFPSWLTFIILVGLILFGFLLIGLVEEGFKFEYPEFNFGWFMTSFELVIFSVFAMSERYGKNRNKLITNDDEINNTKSEMETLILNESKNLDKAPLNDIYTIVFERKMPLKFHVIVAGAMTASRGLTNIALLLLNYPTQVIFKSMKLLSVMIGSVFFLKKSYSLFEYIAAPFLVLSAILFTMGDSTDSLNFNIMGITVVCISLIFDAIHANCQEYILSKGKDSMAELLVYSNFFSGIMACVVSVVAMETIPLLRFLKDISVVTLCGWFVLRVVCLYIGVSAFVCFTKRFGAVMAVTITTVRKIMTVLLSYIFYPGTKSFTSQHMIGTILFMASLMLNAYGKNGRTKTNR